MIAHRKVKIGPEVRISEDGENCTVRRFLVYRPSP
jgi:hypothetical protein